MEPASILNLAGLSVHVPPSPIKHHPPSTSLTQQDATQLAAVDDWISTIAASPEREEAYYDESLPFYLLVRLPTTPLTRAQATFLLLPSLPSPHLTFSADLSYLESRSQSRTSIGLGRPPVDLTGEWEEPRTPAPFPSARKGEGGEQSGTPAWSWAWVEGGGEEGKGKGRERKWGEGRVWVGREGGEEGVGGWIGVWEFRGDVAFVKTSLAEPKLCLTVTMTFRDDPRLHDVLERTSSPRSNGVSASHDDEYLIESFDDVNLLEGLDDYLHLPASRLPRPIPSSSTPARRTSHRSLSLSIPDALHPVTRRSARRVLRVRSALAVRMREVPCVGFGGERRGVGGEAAVEGMAISVEVAGTGERGDGFEVESVELLVTGGAGAGDVEVKELAAGRTEQFPILLGSKNHQFNFLYSVTYSGHDETSAFDEPPLPPPVPIYVATSPSQRFTARPEDVHPSSFVEPPPSIPSKSNAWIREVVIVVTGRPVRVDRSGYSVPNGEEPAQEYPTTSFESRWNCVLDISPFALRAQSHRASFTPLPTPRPLSSFSPANRHSPPRSKPPPTLEAIAGSKRHTIAGLATLLQKTPTLQHPPSRISLSLPSYDPSRALPPTPLEAPTPGATGRRFFSLPASGTPPRTPLDPRPPRSPFPHGVSPTPAYLPHSSTREAFPVAEGRWEERGSVLVSVALIPLRSVKAKARVESIVFGIIEEGAQKDEFQFPAREPKASEGNGGERTPRVGVLDVFLVEVFVLNRGDEVRRFTVGVPPRRGEGLGKDDRVATIVALENDVRIGPLAPQSCQSVRMRFVALRPGAHRLEELRLVDLGTGRETRLKNPVVVVVEG